MLVGYCQDSTWAGGVLKTGSGILALGYLAQNFTSLRLGERRTFSWNNPSKFNWALHLY
jgi:hypothetical protein